MIRSIAIMIFAAAWIWTAAAEELPKADAILDKYVEVTGGKVAYKNIHSVTTTGTMEFVGKGIKATLTSYKAEPANSYNIIDIEGVGKFESGTNGGVAWDRNPLQGPRIKEGEEKAAALRDANVNAAWRELFKKAETAGSETIGDQLCYKVVLTPNEGRPETRYYNNKTNLLVRVTKTVKSPMGDIPAEINVSDYKKEGDILLPHKLQQKGLGQEYVVVLEKIEQNAEIPKGRFDLPDDIKALAEKSKAGGKTEPGK